MSSVTETPMIVRPTLCRLCGHEFKGNSLATAAVVGNNPHAKIQQIQALISPLMKHLTKKHPEQLKWAQMMGGEWGGLLSINFFQCDEPAIEQSRDSTRWKIHQMTRRVVITDERIEERLRLAVLTAITDAGGDQVYGDQHEEYADDFMKGAIARKIVETMRHMRDVLEERGRYGEPEVPAMTGTPAAPKSSPDEPQPA